MSFWLFCTAGSQGEQESSRIALQGTARPNDFFSHQPACTSSKLVTVLGEAKSCGPASLREKSASKQEEQKCARGNQSASRDGDRAGPQKQKQSLANKIAAGIKPLKSAQNPGDPLLNSALREIWLARRL
jgi:hypothetical protein